MDIESLRKLATAIRFARHGLIPPEEEVADWRATLAELRASLDASGVMACRAEQRRPKEWVCDCAAMRVDCKPNAAAGVDVPRPPTAQEDRWLHDAVKRNRTLVAPGKIAAGVATVSTAREYQPEKDGAPGLGSVSAAGNLQIAIEEAIASLEAGMVAGALETLQEALRNAGVDVPGEGKKR